MKLNQECEFWPDEVTEELNAYRATQHVWDPLSLLHQLWCWVRLGELIKDPKPSTNTFRAQWGYSSLGSASPSSLHHLWLWSRFGWPLISAHEEDQGIEKVGVQVCKSLVLHQKVQSMCLKELRLSQFELGCQDFRCVFDGHCAVDHHPELCSRLIACHPDIKAQEQS